MQWRICSRVGIVKARWAVNTTLAVCSVRCKSRISRFASRMQAIGVSHVLSLFVCTSYSVSCSVLLPTFYSKDIKKPVVFAMVASDKLSRQLRSTCKGASTSFRGKVSFITKRSRSLALVRRRLVSSCFCRPNCLARHRRDSLEARQRTISTAPSRALGRHI